MNKKVVSVLVIALVGVFATTWYWFSFQLVDEASLNLKAELQSETTQWGGIERRFHWYAPLETERSPALVFVLHGSMGDGHGARAAYGYGFDTIADREGFIAVYPDGNEGHWNGCRAKGPYSANTENIDDVGYIAHLIDIFVKKYNADRHNVFVTGLSNGGQLAMRMALEAPGEICAVAPVATSLPADNNMGCRVSDEAVSFMLLNGTADPMNPFEGGKVALYGLWGDRGEVQSSQNTVNHWARLAGFNSPPEVGTIDDLNKDDNSVIEVMKWSGIGKQSVALYKVVNGGHNVPHTDMRLPRIIGPTNQDVVGAEIIWAFFKESKSFF